MPVASLCDVLSRDGASVDVVYVLILIALYGVTHGIVLGIHRLGGDAR